MPQEESQIRQGSFVVLQWFLLMLGVCGCFSSCPGRLEARQAAGLLTRGIPLAGLLQGEIFDPAVFGPVFPFFARCQIRKGHCRSRFRVEVSFCARLHLWAPKCEHEAGPVRAVLFAAGEGSACTRIFANSLALICVVNSGPRFQYETGTFNFWASSWISSCSTEAKEGSTLAPRETSMHPARRDKTHSLAFKTKASS